MATLTIIGRSSSGQHYRIDLNEATPISPEAFARLKFYGVTEVPTSFVDNELDARHGTLRVVAR